MATEGESVAAADGSPFCGNCGYTLTGLTESARCPECGRPLVEVLQRRGAAMPNFGKRYRSKATLFGLPVIDVAVGPKNGELRGKAKGIIAVGDIATGVLAIGGMARGLVAIGGLAVGLFAIGGLAVGLVTAAGGLAVGGMAVGGGAVGLLASGGGAAGIFAQGGGAIGSFVRDARYGVRPPPTSIDPFAFVNWFFGPWPPRGLDAWRPMIVSAGLTLAAAAVTALVAWVRLLRESDDPREG